MPRRRSRFRRSTRLTLLAAACCATLLAGCDDPDTGPDAEPDRIALEELPIAPGMTIASEAEDCSLGTEGETNGSCIHLLAITGPPALAARDLVKRQSEFLVSQGWIYEPKGVTVGMHRDDCRARIDLISGRSELKLIGPVVDPVSRRKLSAAYTEHRAALERLTGEGEVIAAHFSPLDETQCPTPGA